MMCTAWEGSVKYSNAITTTNRSLVPFERVKSSSTAKHACNSIHIPFCSHSPCTELSFLQQYGVLLDQWFYKAPEGDSSGYFKCNVTRAMNYKEWSKGEEAEGENKFFIDLKIPYRLFIAQGPSKTNPISY